MFCGVFEGNDKISLEHATSQTRSCRQSIQLNGNSSVMSCMPKNFNEEVTGIEKETSTVAKSLPPFEYEAKKKKSLIVV